MYIIDGASTHRLLDYAGLIEALRRAHCAEMPEVGELVVEEPGSTNGRAMIILPAWQRTHVLGAKIVTVFPENPGLAAPLPTNQGIYAAFDGETGAPLLIADGTALTLRKTAAESALAADILARPDARVMVMAGAGALAPHVIMAMRAVRPSLERLWLWNRTPARAHALASELDDFDIEVCVATQLDDCLAEGDIISSATMAESPLIHGAMLRAGAHVDLIGGWNPQMREADDDAIRRARLFTGRHSQCRDCGDFLQPVESGLIGWDEIEADLFELCSGHKSGRNNSGEITLYKNCGGGHLDLFTASYLLEQQQARQSNDGCASKQQVTRP